MDENDRKSRRRIATMAAAALLAGALQPPTLSQAMADEPKSTPKIPYRTYAGPLPTGVSSWQELMENQSHLDRAADDLARLGKLPGGSGYGSITVSPERRRMVVYWKGKTPSAVSRILARLPAHFVAEVLPARYSEVELESAMVDLLQAAQSLSVQLSEVSPRSDSSGLDVVVPNRAVLQTLMNKHRNSPVSMRVQVGEPMTLQFSRQLDIAPYWGGAVIVGSRTCTTGFAVKSRNNGKRKMVTAGHCGENGATARITDGFNGNYDVVAGKFEGKVTQFDLVLIDMPVQARVYRGNGYSSKSSPVGGWNGTYIGDWACTGGAQSGEICGQKVTRVNATVGVNGTSGTYIKGLAKSEHVLGLPVGMGGDSGGPVLTPGSDGSVKAKGTITGGQQSAPCYTGGPPSCYKVAVFQPITTAFAVYDVELIQSAP